jgi:leader peptidase (prepilin peptidase)/N-methyltransferase
MGLQIISAILAFCFGAIIGSFLNVVILRLPEGQSLNGRSHCPKCGHVLGFLDLFPLLSFIFLRGRCRFCKTKISPRYFILEAAAGFLFAAAYFYLQPASFIQALLLLKFWVILAALLVIFVVDLEHFLILDSVIFPVSGAILILNIVLDFCSKISVFSLHSNFLSGLLAAAGLWLLFFLVWFFSKGLWLGFGDVKLAVLLGLTLGWPLILAGFMLAVFLGGAVSVFLLAFGGKNLKSQVPFGTFLALGTVLALFYGDKLISWYLAILGF